MSTINWDIIEEKIQRFRAIGMESMQDFERFNEAAIVHHSCSIEGSTLTLIETQLLLQEGITAKGKPLEHHLMAKDHWAALHLVQDLAHQKRIVDVKGIQKIASYVMKSTGGIVNTAVGNFDTSNGDLRKSTVYAGQTIFPSYEKVPLLMANLVQGLREKITSVEGIGNILRLSYEAHFQLVSIHPFGDGNGRTSRLLANYVQAFHGLPLGLVHREDKAGYIQALIKSREEETTDAICYFMYEQQVKYLDEELLKFEKRDKGLNFGIFL